MACHFFFTGPPPARLHRWNPRFRVLRPSLYVYQVLRQSAPGSKWLPRRGRCIFDRGSFHLLTPVQIFFKFPAVLETQQHYRAPTSRRSQFLDFSFSSAGGMSARFSSFSADKKSSSVVDFNELSKMCLSASNPGLRGFSLSRPHTRRQRGRGGLDRTLRQGCHQFPP